MKRLSEIGDSEHFRGINPPFDVQIVSVCDIAPGAFEGYETIVALTTSERRELVTEAIKRWEAFRWKIGASGQAELEEFLEDQGL